MGTLDTMFANPLDCYFALFQDAVFEHDNDINYVFERGQFKRRNRGDILKIIGEMADRLYAQMGAKNKMFSLCKPHVDYSALLGVVCRYSRDIYGFRRIKAKLENLERVVGPTANLKEEIENIILEGGDFGFLIPSSSPYIHRQAAVLLYWFSVLKPFHLELKEPKAPYPEEYFHIYFNEYLAYSLINIALHAQSVELTVHKNKVYFKDEFLNQLHFRKLSRSSLEFFLPNWTGKYPGQN
jgi:hypothetical protein